MQNTVFNVGRAVISVCTVNDTEAAFKMLFYSILFAALRKKKKKKKTLYA